MVGDDTLTAICSAMLQSGALGAPLDCGALQLQVAPAALCCRRFACLWCRTLPTSSPAPPSCRPQPQQPPRARCARRAAAVLHLAGARRPGGPLPGRRPRPCRHLPRAAALLVTVDRGSHIEPVCLFKNQRVPASGLCPGARRRGGSAEMHIPPSQCSNPPPPYNLGSCCRRLTPKRAPTWPQRWITYSH